MRGDHLPFTAALTSMPGSGFEIMVAVVHYTRECHYIFKTYLPMERKSCVSGKRGGITMTSAPAKQDEIPIDLERAVREFDADREFLLELVRGFLNNVRGQVETIRAAMEKGDAETVRREAHSIKGGAANICAESLSLAAWKLETAGKSGSLDNGGEMLGELQHEFSRLEGYVRNELGGGE